MQLLQFLSVTIYVEFCMFSSVGLELYPQLTAL